MDHVATWTFDFYSLFQVSQIEQIRRLIGLSGLFQQNAQLMIEWQNAQWKHNERLLPMLLFWFEWFVRLCVLLVPPTSRSTHFTIRSFYIDFSKIWSSLIFLSQLSDNCCFRWNTLQNKHWFKINLEWILRNPVYPLPCSYHLQILSFCTLFIDRSTGGKWLDVYCHCNNSLLSTSIYMRFNRIWQFHLIA